MKKVAIIGANGKSGSALVAEALRQGYDVTGFARNKEYKNGAIKLVHKDVFETNKADVAGFDVVISAIAAWTPQTFPLHAKMTQHIAELLSGTQTRLFVIGGAGVLYTDASRKTRLMVVSWTERKIAATKQAIEANSNSVKSSVLSERRCF